MKRIVNSCLCRLALAGATLLFAAGGCSSHKLRLPIEEIKRPLSLPPRNWRIGLEAGAAYSSDFMDKPYLDLGFIFQYPYFQLGNRWEYYIPASFTFYFLKNTDIVDSVVYLNGPNCAVTAGWTGFYLSHLLGLCLTFGGTIDYKKPLTDRLWMISGVVADYETNTNDFAGRVSAGIGAQITSRIYATFGPSVQYTKHTLAHSETRVRTWRDDLSANVPLVLGINLTKKWSLFWKTHGSFYWDSNLNFGSTLGFHYTW